MDFKVSCRRYAERFVMSTLYTLTMPFQRSLRSDSSLDKNPPGAALRVPGPSKKGRRWPFRRQNDGLGMQ